MKDRSGHRSDLLPGGIDARAACVDCHGKYAWVIDPANGRVLYVHRSVWFVGLVEGCVTRRWPEEVALVVGGYYATD